MTRFSLLSLFLYQAISSPFSWREFRNYKYMVTTDIRFQAYVSAIYECVDTCKHAYRDCTVAVFDAQAVTIAFYKNKIMPTQKRLFQLNTCLHAGSVRLINTAKHNRLREFAEIALTRAIRLAVYFIRAEK